MQQTSSGQRRGSFVARHNAHSPTLRLDSVVHRARLRAALTPPAHTSRPSAPEKAWPLPSCPRRGGQCRAMSDRCDALPRDRELAHALPGWAPTPGRCAPRFTLHASRFTLHTARARLPCRGPLSCSLQQLDQRACGAMAIGLRPGLSKWSPPCCSTDQRALLPRLYTHYTTASLSSLHMPACSHFQTGLAGSNNARHPCHTVPASTVCHLPPCSLLAKPKSTPATLTASAWRAKRYGSPISSWSPFLFPTHAGL